MAPVVVHVGHDALDVMLLRLDRRSLVVRVERAVYDDIAQAAPGERARAELAIRQIRVPTGGAQ